MLTTRHFPVASSMSSELPSVDEFAGDIHCSGDVEAEDERDQGEELNCCNMADSSCIDFLSVFRSAFMPTSRLLFSSPFNLRSSYSWWSGTQASIPTSTNILSYVSIHQTFNVDTCSTVNGSSCTCSVRLSRFSLPGRLLNCTR